MKNETKQGTISILIFRTEDRYMGLCKEFGFIEEGDNPQEIHNRLMASALLLIETVAKNRTLMPSLNAGLPLKYRVLFYSAPFISACTSIFKRFRGDMRLMTLNVPAYV